MTARVVITGRASTDLDLIDDHLHGAAGHRTARRYGAAFDALFDHLAEHPRPCSMRPELGLDVRVGVVKPYVVLYRFSAEADVVSVLRILHGRRRIATDRP